MKKETVVYEGVVYTIPVIEDQGEIPFGIVRKISFLEDEIEMQSRTGLLLLEHFLTKKELDAWDNLPNSKLEEVMSLFSAEAKESMVEAQKK